MKVYLTKLTLLVVICSGLFNQNFTTQACSRMFPFKLSEIFEADVIVRATAQSYVKEPDPNTVTTGIPESTVKFKVEEVLFGQDFPSTVTIPGYLSERDDFNNVPLPYRFVRPGGRHGSCFANSYRKGAQFLLFLRKSYYGYTPYWGALAPVNEQLRGTEDPWLKWVRAYLSPCVGESKSGADFGTMSQQRMIAQERRAMSGGDLEKYRYAKCYSYRFGMDGERGKRYAKVVANYETTPQAQ